MLGTFFKVNAMAALLTLSNVAMAQTELVTFSNGEKITASDLQAYVVRRVDLRTLVRHYWGVGTVLNEMAMTRTLVLEGEKMGEPKGKRPADERFDDIYAAGIYAKIGAKCVRPSNDVEVRAYFDAHPQAFVLPAQARLSRIILPFTVVADGVPAMGWLLGRAQAVASGTAQMNDVAEQAKALYSLEQQGDVGWLWLSDDNTIMRAIAQAKPGEIVGPVREGEFGYMFQVLAIRPSRQMTWEEVSTGAAARSHQHCLDEARKQATAKLFADYGVVINQAAIREMFRETQPPAVKPEK